MEPHQLQQLIRRTVGKWVSDTYRRRPMILPRRRRGLTLRQARTPERGPPDLHRGAPLQYVYVSTSPGSSERTCAP